MTPAKRLLPPWILSHFIRKLIWNLFPIFFRHWKPWSLPPYPIRHRKAHSNTHIEWETLMSSLGMHPQVSCTLLLPSSSENEEILPVPFPPLIFSHSFTIRHNPMTFKNKLSTVILPFFFPAIWYDCNKILGYEVFLCLKYWYLWDYWYFYKTQVYSNWYLNTDASFTSS